MAEQDWKHFRVTVLMEHVAHVEINRPEKANAFYEPMWLEMREIFNNLSINPEVRAVVLSGAGPKAFTAGLDLQEETKSGILATTAKDKQDVARTAIKLRRGIETFQDCISAIERCEKPVIVVLHGYALGLAIDIAVAADVRICASDTQFAVKEVDVALAADIGTLSRLPKVVASASWVKDVCLTARNFGAEEALQVGLVSGVFASKEKAIQEGLKMAGVIAEKSPIAVIGTKELLNYSRDHSIAEGLKYTAVWNAAAIQTDDMPTAMRAAFQKKTPKFSKL